MSWDATWERIFAARPWGRYPPEEVVRFAASSFARIGDVPTRVLELGCGPGANVWFFAREGFDVHGIDGSSVAIKLARRRLEKEGLSATLVCGDFTDLRAYEPEQFDAIIDVAALQHNRRDAIDTTMAQARDLLKPGGMLFSMLVSSGSWGDGLGRELEPGTFDEISEGPLSGTGVARFSTIDDVRWHFRRFEDVSIECSARTLEGRSRLYSHWVATGVRSS